MDLRSLDYALLRDVGLVGLTALSRTTSLLLITPFLSRGNLPGLARNGVILAVTLPVFPMAFFTRPEGLADLGIVVQTMLIAKEALIGLLLGLPMATAVWGLEAAGFFIDNQRGTTMASSLDPATGSTSSPMGIFFAQVFTTWLFVTGGFLVLLDALYESHRVWPIWSFLPAIDGRLVPAVLHLLDTIMKLAVVLSAPAILAMMLSELGLALVSKFAPQLQVFFVAMPLKSGVGLLMLVLSLSVIMAVTNSGIPNAAGLIDWVRHIVVAP